MTDKTKGVETMDASDHDDASDDDDASESGTSSPSTSKEPSGGEGPESSESAKPSGPGTLEPVSSDQDPLGGESSKERGDDTEEEAVTAVEERSKEASPSVAKKILGFAQSSLGLGFVLFLGVFIGMQFSGTAPEGHSQDDGHKHGEEATKPKAAPVWTCSMHPQIRMEESGSCPICGMDLIPVAVEPESDDDDGGHTPQGGRVVLSRRARALAAIQTVPVLRTESRTEIRLLGRVDYDETRLRTVTPWTAGRIDRLLVRVTGTRIRKNRVVAKLYSPEIYTATRELVLAVKQAKKLSGGLGGASGIGTSTLEAARNRLRLLGVQGRVISEIERSGKAPEKINIRSPFSGTVVERHVEEGQYVSAGTPLFSIANLTEVWVQIDAYESDLPYLQVGQEVELMVEAVPGEVFTGKVGFIDPVLDKRNRTARVRVEVANREGLLSPGMFAQARILAGGESSKSQLVVPSSAPLFTGRRSVVYIEVPNRARPTFELREVRLGPKAGPVYPVLSGLIEGDRVVSRGAFLLDADLQLSGGRSMMTLIDDSEFEKEPPLRVTKAFLESIAPVVDAYLGAQEKLAADDFEGAKEALAQLGREVNEIEPPGSREALEAWQESASVFVSHVRHVAKSEDIGGMRSAFEMLSMEIERVLERFGNPSADPVRLAFCPMAFDSRGARWVQRDGPLQNPYYGEAMLRCGEWRANILPGERLPRGATANDAPSPAAPSGHQH